MVFKINNTSYSGNCVVGGYDVSLEDVYFEWKDGFGRKHRNVTGRKAVGSVSMYFNNENDYIGFINALSNCRTAGGAYPLTVSVNNDINEVTDEFYISFAPIRTRNAASHDVFEEFDLNIEQR